jgi:glycosyltransferase involved in cell wall biosynthesis
MKVAYITGQFPCTSERFIAREISALVRRGFEIRVFSLMKPKGKASEEGAVAPVYYRPGPFSWSSFSDACYIILRFPIRCMRTFCEVMRNKPNSMGYLKMVRHFLTAMSFAREAGRTGVDHIHAHFAFVTADIAVAMAGMLGMRYSVSVHAWDLYAQSDDSIAKRVSGARKVVACTEHGRARVMAAVPGIPEDSVVVVRHGLVPDEWRRRDEGRGQIILGVGRLVAKKGFGDLVKACRMLKDRDIKCSCVIVGDGPGRGDLELAIKEEGLSDTVVLMGELTADALRNEFGKAAMFVLPSVVGEDGDRDGVPNAMIEAMAMKLPVIVTNASAAPEVVRAGEHGYVVEPGNETQLADKIAALLGDAELCKQMGDAGRALVEEEFDIDKNIAMMAEILT